jgi:hypothetical protein
MESVLTKQIEEARKVISKNKVDQKLPSVLKEMKDALDCLRGAIMIVYPAYHGLPPWEPVRTVLENKFDWEAYPTDIFDVKNMKAFEILVSYCQGYFYVVGWEGALERKDPC